MTLKLSEVSLEVAAEVQNVWAGKTIVVQGGHLHRGCAEAWSGAPGHSGQ